MWSTSQVPTLPIVCQSQCSVSPGCSREDLELRAVLGRGVCVCGAPLRSPPCSLPSGNLCQSWVCLMGSLQLDRGVERPPGCSAPATASQDECSPCHHNLHRCKALHLGRLLQPLSIDRSGDLGVKAVLGPGQPCEA